MSIVSKPYTFSANTTISSSNMNSNFDTLYNDYNGGISAANLATGAVTTSKIADANVTTAKIADDNVTAAKIDFGGSGAGVWWEEIARTTLGIAGDAITVSSIPARKYLRIIVYTAATGGTTDLRLRFNNDSGSNYAYRESSNGGADNTAVSQSSILVSGAAARTYFYTVDVFNVADQEKYTTGFRADTTAGAGNAPNKVEQIGKWVNTTNQITRVDILNTVGTGDYAIGSEVVVLGHD